MDFIARRDSRASEFLTLLPRVSHWIPVNRATYGVGTICLAGNHVDLLTGVIGGHGRTLHVTHATCSARVSCCQMLKARDRIARQALAASPAEQMEEAMDKRKSGKEALSLFWRFESLHPAFSTSCSTM